MTNAREWKLKAQEASRAAVTKATGRRSSRVVTTYFVPVKGDKPKARKPQPQVNPHMSKPKGLSPAARFDMLKPDIVHPWDWLELFIEDEELWPSIVEVAIEAVECGELQRYERTVTNG